MEVGGLSGDSVVSRVILYNLNDGVDALAHKLYHFILELSLKGSNVGEVREPPLQMNDLVKWMSEKMQGMSGITQK